METENRFITHIRKYLVPYGIGAAFVVGLGISAVRVGIAEYTREDVKKVVLPAFNCEDEQFSIKRITVQRDSLDTILAAACSKPALEDGTDWDARVAEHENCLVQYQGERRNAVKYKKEKDAAIVERNAAVAKNAEDAITIANYEQNPNVKVVYKKDTTAQSELDLARKNLADANANYHTCDANLKIAQHNEEIFSNYNVGLQREGKNRQDAIADLLGPAVYFTLVYQKNIPQFCYLMESYFIPAVGVNTPEQWAKLRKYQKESPNYYDEFNTRCVTLNLE